MSENETRVTTFRVGDEELVVISVPATVDHRSLSLLTTAEREVVRHVARGRTNREISAQRGTSIRTVANQLASVYRKLSLRGRGELVALLCGGTDRG